MQEICVVELYWRVMYCQQLEITRSPNRKMSRKYAGNVNVKVYTNVKVKRSWPL
jgi:hypothetical protein